MQYRRAGRSGIDLPVLSLGFWHNFGEKADPEVARSLALRAFDLGITYFDTANEYGPPGGAAEITLSRILKSDLWAHRDELFIATKAGFRMWPGPYGDHGSRKYLLASLDQSLRRLGLEYVDVFYHHRQDLNTPLEETMGALDRVVRSGKALYVGLSNYDPDRMERAITILRSLGTPCLLNQPQYSMLQRKPEQGLFSLLAREGVGCAIFSALAQGVLTGKYLDGIPDDSRAADPDGFLTVDAVHRRHAIVRALNDIAVARGQTLAQMALTWALRRPEVTSIIIGVSKVQQLKDDVAALAASPLSEEELASIDRVLEGA